MDSLFPFPRSKAQIRTMSPANWAEAPADEGLASMVLKLETTAYPALFFSIQDKAASISVPDFLRVGQDLLALPLGDLSSGTKFLG